MSPNSPKNLFRVESPDSDLAPTDTFHWLLILGFPITIAAALAMPELFRADEREQIDSPLFRRA